MDPCHPMLTSTSPARTSALTITYLIRNIEQLKNKDKLISQLEKDLGHQWVSAHQAAHEQASISARCHDNMDADFNPTNLPQSRPPSPTMGEVLWKQSITSAQARGASIPNVDAMASISPPARALPPMGKTEQEGPNGYCSRTPSSTATTSGVEDAWTTTEDIPLSKQDLHKALKESKTRNKELLFKCRAYLQRNKELTAQTRAYKDSSVKLLEENSKMTELLENSKLKCLQLSREADDANADRNWVQQTSHIMGQARIELAEAHKTIAALKQACSDKDRRIELIQHRKKRRRLVGADDKSIGGETYFGYEEDTRSVDSSLSRSTMSDEDVWDDVLSREETERNYQRLMMEHLQLQRSYLILQKQETHLQDPQREERTKHELQNELFHAQCRIEKLEMMLRELGQGELTTLLKEREIMMSNLRSFQQKHETSERETRQVKKELNQALGRAEDLEFRLAEMEQQIDDMSKIPPCSELTESHEDNLNDEKSYQEQARKEETVNQAQDKQSNQHYLVTDQTQLISGEIILQPDEKSQAGKRHRQASGDSSCSSISSAGFQALLGSLNLQHKRLGEESAAHIYAMERLKTDLAALLKGRGKEAETILKRLDNITQEEKTRRDDLEYMAHELQMKVISLQQELDTPQGKAASHRKEEHNRHSNAEKSMSDSIAKEKQENLELKAAGHKRQQPEDVHQYQQILISQQQQQLQQNFQPLRLKQLSPTTSPIKTPSPPLTELRRKNSKDRKSRPRSGDDPTETKRRRSSQDHNAKSALPPSGAKLKNAKSVGDLKSEQCDYNNHSSDCTLRTSISIGELHTQVKHSPNEDKENQESLTLLKDKLSQQETELNMLRQQLRQRPLERRTEAEADQGDDQCTLVERINILDAEVSYLKMENEGLTSRLRQQRLHDDIVFEIGSHSSVSSLGKVTEMEECLENLREQLEAREGTEKLLRERLRLYESSAEELEAAEMSAREKYEELLAREAENSRQTRQLQQTCRELRDCLMDKEIMEQGLSDKVDFLQKAEAASVQRVEELEIEVKELRTQLHEALQQADDFSGSDGSNQRELNKIQELKHQLTFLETDNKALQGRVSELEENEETLRENWRRVAEEDFSRIQGLEQKVKSLEQINKQLRADVAEAQEYFVISSVPETSLAAEIAHSQSAALQASSAVEASSASLDGSSETDRFETGGGIVRKDSEKRTLKDKLKMLEKQLSEEVEKKTSTIENLQETIVGLKENEIKLSETISEMEMTERELRAKLALYESSEITVEKMLKYQHKIEELRTSQESLLDQLETMENQEMTLQEKMQEMERTLRGKIVTLEVEIKGYKTRELKNAARIRDLEKQEKELTEKTEQQAEKENSLYVKISTLMDDVKRYKEQSEALRVQLVDKEDKMRKAKLLEVKFLEIEMEFSKKMSDLSTKLRHKEEELRQKEVAHEDELSALNEQMEAKDAENARKISKLQEELTNTETDMQQAVENLKKQISSVSSERNAFEINFSNMKTKNESLSQNNTQLVKELTDLKAEVASLNSFESESQRMVIELQESINLEKGFTDEAESKVKSLLEELDQGKGKIATLEKEIASLRSDVEEKSRNAVICFEKKCEVEKEKESLEEELILKSERLQELEEQLEYEQSKVNDLESDRKRLEQKLSALTADQSEQKSTIQELENKIKTDHNNYAEKVAALEEEQKVLENELKNKVMFLNTQLNKEVESRESESSALEKLSQQEQDLKEKVAKLEKVAKGHKADLLDTLSELEINNKEKCELSLQLSNMKHELDSCKESASEIERQLRKQLSEKTDYADKLQEELINGENKIHELQAEISQKENLVLESDTHKERLVQEKEQEIAKLLEENNVKELMVQEHIQKSESVVLQSKQDHQNELEVLKEQVAELKETNVHLQQDNNEFESQREDLQSQIQTLELYLSEVNFKLDSKSTQCRKREQELSNALADHEKSVSEMKVLNEKLHDLQRQIEERDAEYMEKASETSESLSLVSAKEQELEHAREELKKCLSEIEHYKTQVKDKEDNIKSKEQERQELKTCCQKLEEQNHQRDTDFKQMESKVTGYDLKLTEAENRYMELEAKCASLELQLEERFAQAQRGEEILRAKEEKCQELATKLTNVEKEFELVTQVVDKSEQIVVEKKRECSNLKSQLNEFHRQREEMEFEISDKNNLCEELHRKIEGLSSSNERLKQQLADNENLFEKSNELEEDLNVTKTELTDTNTRLGQIAEKLKETEEDLVSSKQQVLDLTGQLDSLKRALDEKDSYSKDNERGLKGLEKELLEARIEIDNFKSKVNYLQEISSRNQARNTENEEKLKENEVAFIQSKEELLKMQKELSGKESVLEKQSEKLTASQKEKEELRNRINVMDNENDVSEKKISTLSERNNSLDSVLSEKESLCQKLESELLVMEEQLKNEKQQVVNAQSEIASLSTKIKSLEEEKIKHSEANECQEQNLKSLQLHLDELKEEKLRLEQLCSKNTSVISDLEEMKHLYDSLNIEKDTVESKMKASEKDCEALSSELKLLKEQLLVSNKNVIELQDSLIQKDCENKDLRSELDSFELTLESTKSKTNEELQTLLTQIETFEKSDKAKEEMLKQLNLELDNIKVREHKLCHRVEELESKEKQLLEQITDIEATVIIPLENENQELKDEAEIVKQERDEAIAALDQKQEEEGEVREYEENLKRLLEDSKEKQDELQNKVEILLADISSLETDRDSLNNKVSELHDSNEDLAEKCELLEIEIERYKDLEKQSSVVEEAETRLMDRVLDLEEREQQLTTELNSFKSRNVSSHASQTELGTSYSEMKDRIQYLEQKVEVLKDAEEKYMDTIVQLQEINGRLEAQLANSHKATESKQITSSSIENPLSLPVNETINASKTFTTYASVKLGSMPQQNSSSSIPEEPRETISPAEILLQEQSKTTLDDYQNLVKALEESEKKNKDLEIKIGLLEDSESRLMERLVDTEELSQSNLTDNDMKHKMEALVEENEFLAENIENYKQMYKEEKQKNNALNDRLLEDSSMFQELDEAKLELETMHDKMIGLQSEHDSKLDEKEKIQSELYSLLEQNEQSMQDDKLQIKDLEEKLSSSHQLSNQLRFRESEIQRELSDSRQEFEDLKNKSENLQTQIIGLELERKDLQQTKDDMAKKINDLEQETKDLKHIRNDLTSEVEGLQRNVNDIQHREGSILERMQQVQQERERLEEQVDSGRAKEQSLEQKVDDLEQEVQYLRNQMEEVMSDSGVSGDGHKNRYSSFESEPRRFKSPSPVAEEIDLQQTSVNLTRPPGAASPPYLTSKPDLSAQKINPSSITNLSSHSHPSISRRDDTPSPVAPPRPRSRRSRPSSIDSVTQEELLFLVEELQAKEAILKKRVIDLEAITDIDLPQKVDELEKENHQLKQTVERLELLQEQSPSQSSVLDTSHQEEVEGTSISLRNTSYHFSEGDRNNNASFSDKSSQIENKPYSVITSTKYSDTTSDTSSFTMLDKPKDVLQQRIKELEHLDVINKNQLSELERDREVLHEIARKDKATIHDLNVRIRELQLSERGLKEQVSSLEISESSLFTRCEDLDATRSSLEDRVHELEVHERRLRELVRRLKLDEERWLGRSGGMETALGELSASESQLKRMLQDSEMEKGGLTERTAYMEARVKELEAAEASLSQKVKILQSSEANLQKKLSQLENSEVAAHSKAAELDVLNADLSQRLQAGLEERSMLTQHLQQMHGQIQDLDRRLIASRDSELAHKQHVESLQKNESSLQKRVREFELREIDSQAKIRELEQTQEIMGDKIAALQRSENRLRYRVQELEGMGGQIPGELNPEQKEKLPQKLEDCQKRIVLLQNYVENLQMQIRENLKVSQKKLSSSDSTDTVPVPVLELNTLKARSTLLEDTTYQLQQVESINEELNDTILRLKDGKGVGGREAEIEVLKRRVASYKACIDKLKSSLSTGQATSLMEPEFDSGPDGETLPARHLGGLESERVLQSVRGLEGKKPNGFSRSSNDGTRAHENSVIQTKTTANLSSAPISLDLSFAEDTSNAETEYEWNSLVTKPNDEENHWRAIETRQLGTVTDSPKGGGVLLSKNDLSEPNSSAMTVGNVRDSKPSKTRGHPNEMLSTGEISTLDVEEMTVAVHLQSESELSSHYTSRHDSTVDTTAQNETDSSLSPVPPPRKSRKSAGTRSALSSDKNQTSTKPSKGSRRDESVNKMGVPENNIDTMNHEQYFGKTQNQTMPHKSSNIAKHTYINSQTNPTPPPFASFGKRESIYLPSPAKTGSEDDDDDGPPPPLPTSLPPGNIEERLGGSEAGSLSPVPDVDAGRKDSVETSTSGMSIRQRIALIEQQLQSDHDSPRGDEQNWKMQASENLMQVKLLEKDNSHMKEDINKLEKELEEKRRHINTLEVWLSSLDELLKNKNKQTDREMVEQLQLDLNKLRVELSKSGHRPEGNMMDPAALRTELEHRDKEISSKRTELQALSQELQKCKEECRSIEGMRRTALDSLRGLEEEVVMLQDKEKQLDQVQGEIKELKAKTEKTREVYEENLLLREKVHEGELELRRLRGLCDDFNNLSARYDELKNQKQQIEARLQPVEAQRDRLVRKCQQKDALLLDLGDELRHHSARPSQALDELERMQRLMALEEYNTDFPPMSNGSSQMFHNKKQGPSRSSSMEELDYHFNPLGNERRDRRKQSGPSVIKRPQSAEGILESGYSWNEDVQRPSTNPLPRDVRRVIKRNDNRYRVIADYDPSVFSQSGRPGLELELVEGDIVTVTGAVDRTGYYEAEVNGRSGLVPANYLLPLHGGQRAGLRPDGIGTFLSGDLDEDQSPEQILDMFNQLLHDTPGQKRPGVGMQPNLNKQARTLHSTSVMPDPPCNLVIRQSEEGDGTFLLSWQPPILDAHGCNNGLQVLGYMVYVDNQEYEQIPSINLCQVLIEGLAPGQSHTLAVQSLCGNGQASARAQLLFQGVVNGRKRKGEDREVNLKDTDLSSILDRVHHRKGQRRKVLALYDYRPDQDSPGDYPQSEMHFQAGDIMTVYGEPRPDGFLHGELGGRKGLVPACFVSDVSESPRNAQKVPVGAEIGEMSV